jgi:hypothetical protein
MEQPRGVRLIMTVDSMEPHASEKYAMYFDPVHTKVIVSSDVSSTPKTTPRVLQLKSDGIGGLSGHIATIDRTLAFLAHAAPNLPDPYLLGPTALLLHRAGRHRKNHVARATSSMPLDGGVPTQLGNSPKRPGQGCL